MTPTNPVARASEPVSEWPRPPFRHGSDLRTTRRMARQLRWTLRGNIEPDHRTWADLGAALWDGDPLADEVAAWLLREGMATGRIILERAIEGGWRPCRMHRQSCSAFCARPRRCRAGWIRR